MTWHYYLFVAAMLGFHYPIAWIYVNRCLARVDPNVQRDIRAALQSKMMLLAAVWAIALAVVTVFVILSGGTQTALSVLVQAGIWGFHVIWWPFVVPIFRAMERELEQRGIARSSQNAGPQRIATLRPRRAAEYLPASMRALVVVVGLAGLGGVAWRLSVHTPEQARLMLLTAVFTSSGLVMLAAWGLWIHREIAASYVVDGSAETQAARMAAMEDVRKFRVRAICMLLILGAGTFFAIAIACVEVDRGTLSERSLGLYGGIAGAVVGLGGAAFGAVAGARTLRAKQRVEFGDRMGHRDSA